MSGFIDKIKDALDPTDEIGAGLAKGGLTELVKALEKYPVAVAVAQGKKIAVETHTVTTVQLRVVD